MSVRILYDREQDSAALYCSTTDAAFGPVFYDDVAHDADERAESFLRWLAPRDARDFTDGDLHQAYSTWLAPRIRTMDG